MGFKKYCLFIVLLFTFSVSAIPMPEYSLTKQSLEQPIHEYLTLAEPSNISTPDEILTLDNHEKLWKLSSDNESGNSSPYANTGSNWFAFRVINATNKDTKYYLSISSSIKGNDQQIYIGNKDGEYSRVNQTALKANMFISTLPLMENEQLDVLIYVDAKSGYPIPITLLSGDRLIHDITLTQFSYGVAIGGVVALALTLMFLYLANKNKMMMLLAGYFLAKALLLAVLLGINAELLYPNNVNIKGLELPILNMGALFCLLWFVASLFKLKALLPAWEKTIKVSCWVLLIYMPVSVQLPLVTNLVICMAANIIVSIFLIALGLTLLKSKHRLALLFTGIMALQLTVYLLDIVWGVNQINLYGDNLALYSVSFWLHAFFITYLLSTEHHFQLQEQQADQDIALANAISAKQAQDELLDLQQNSQDILESKVQERTIELNIALQELEDANKELEEKNTRDELTGLFNRRFYDQKILAEYRRSRRNLTPLSLIVFDIDHFKSVNDTHGHLAGDECIVSVAQAFKHCLRRGSDMACRYGGEEFCIILPETDSKGAVALAEDIRQFISKLPVTYNEECIELTVSAGISTYQQQAETGTDELFAAADQALYQAKEQGRNQVQQQPIEPASSS